MPAGCGMCPMWSNTIAEGSRFHKSWAATIWSAVMLICTCQPSAFTLFDKGSIISMDVGAVLGLLSEKRMPTSIEMIEPLRSEQHTSELQSLAYLVCRLLLE